MDPDFRGIRSSGDRSASPKRAKDNENANDPSQERVPNSVDLNLSALSSTRQMINSINRDRPLPKYITFRSSRPAAHGHPSSRINARYRIFSHRVSPHFPEQTTKLNSRFCKYYRAFLETICGGQTQFRNYKALNMKFCTLWATIVWVGGIFALKAHLCNHNSYYTCISA